MVVYERLKWMINKQQVRQKIQSLHIVADYQQHQAYLPHISPAYETTKRIIDILMALIGLLFFALLLPWIALCIFFEDRGPLFYKQIRVGKNGKAFTMYKLRTMIIKADEYLQQNPLLLQQWLQKGKIEKDPRITRVGTFLRRTSLDELPQFLNVLQGDMSLVGPRAIQFSERAIFSDMIELREMVKPGITGLWQIHGRSTMDYEQRKILDCTYVWNCSLGIDFLILLKTIPVVCKGIGSY